MKRLSAASRKRPYGRRPETVFGCPAARGTAKKNELGDLERSGRDKNLIIPDSIILPRQVVSRGYPGWRVREGRGKM